MRWVDRLELVDALQRGLGLGAAAGGGALAAREGVQEAL